jgi:cystathionine beta-synthase
MKYYASILETIGRTPLVKLSKVTENLPVTILVKVEYLNPGGSVKDRIGLAMIEDAERRGLLKPGATIIEATAGNTGVGLALVAARKGYRCIFVMPDKMSDDKVNLLKAYGAEVVITSTAVPPDSPESYNGVAERLAREIPGAFRPNQFENKKNPEAHYRSTGREIWEDTDGKIDVFVAGMGTGGTISGTGRYLKEQNPNVIIIGADPAGSILSGDSPKSFRVEGIGEDFIPATFNRQVVDDMIRVSDAESFAMARRLAREEGILAGGSSGTAVAAALKYALRLDPGKIIVVLLPDTGRNYLTKIFSDRWMWENGFLDNAPDKVATGEVLKLKEGIPSLVTVRADDQAIAAVGLFKRHSISQVPVIDNDGVVGSLNEVTLVKLLRDRVDLETKRVSEIMGKPLPQVDESIDVSEPYRLFLSGHSGVIVTKSGTPYGFLSRIDLVNYWTRKSREEQTL